MVHLGQMQIRRIDRSYAPQGNPVRNAGREEA